MGVGEAILCAGCCKNNARTTRKRCLSCVESTKDARRGYGNKARKPLSGTGAFPECSHQRQQTHPALQRTINIAVTRPKLPYCKLARWSALQAHLERTTTQVFGTILKAIANRHAQPSLVFSVLCCAYLPVRLHIATPHILPRIHQVLLHRGQDGRLVLCLARR